MNSFTNIVLFIYSTAQCLAFTTESIHVQSLGGGDRGEGRGRGEEQ